MVADPPLTESSKSWWKGCPSFAASWPLLPNRLHSTAEDEPHVAVSTTRSEDGAESTALVRQTHAVLGTACESVPPGGMAKAQNSGGAPSIPLADLGVTSRVRALVGGSPRRQASVQSVDCEDTDRRADKFDNRKPLCEKKPSFTCLYQEPQPTRRLTTSRPSSSWRPATPEPPHRARPQSAARATHGQSSSGHRGGTGAARSWGTNRRAPRAPARSPRC